MSKQSFYRRLVPTLRVAGVSARMRPRKSAFTGGLVPTLCVGMHTEPIHISIAKHRGA
jgi:hypothetical protein